MKIRNGFVSNSSSSSFFLYGTQRAEGLEAVCKTLFDATRSELSKQVVIAYGDRAFENVLWNILTDNTLTYAYDGESDTVYIGGSPIDMRDDETAGEFKNTVKTKLSRLFNADVECGWDWGEIDG